MRAYVSENPPTNKIAMRTALLIIDMQQGSFPPFAERHDREGVVRRMNDLARGVREKDGVVIAVQHDGPEGDPHHPDAPGWALLPDLDVAVSDIHIRKTACDAFLDTDLDKTISRLNIEALIVTGCASDYCVDAPVRTALGKGISVVVPSDAHTTSDKPHAGAATVIAHHNAIWSDFIAPAGPARVLPTEQVLASLAGR